MKNFKKVLALVLVLATLLGLATMASATEYKDADKIDGSYDEAIKVLDLIETMQGYPNGEFRPTANITREEAAKLIAIFDNKDSDISTYYTSINPFADEKGRWGESYVGYGYRAGIIAGMNATTFAPTANVTGTQFLKMALVTLGYDQEAEGFVGSSWAVNVLALAKRIGLIDGLNDGWKPENDLTRQEAAQILLNTLNASTVEYGSEAKLANFKPTKILDVDGWNKYYDSTTNKAFWDNDEYYAYTFNGKFYVTVAGAVKTGHPLYEDFDLDKKDSDDAFMRPYTKWILDDESVEQMKAPKATFTTKFSACELLVALGIKETDTDTEIVIDDVYVNGEDVGSELYNEKLKDTDEENNVGVWSHTTSECNADDYIHGAQGTLTQVFLMKTVDGVKHYRVCSIDTWLAEVKSVTKKTTARDEHLRAEGSVTLSTVYTINMGDEDGYSLAYCNGSDDDARYPGQCDELVTTLTYDDPTGLEKGDMVLITYSFKENKNGDYEGVQSVDVAPTKDARFNGFKSNKVADDPTETRIDGEFVKDAVHFHLGYKLSKNEDKFGTYTFYFDAYGNVIGMEESKDTSNWAVIDRAWTTFDNEGETNLNVKVVDLNAESKNGTAKKFENVDDYAAFDWANDVDFDELDQDDLAYTLAVALKNYTNGEGNKDFKAIYDHLVKVTVDSNGKYSIRAVVDGDDMYVDALGDSTEHEWIDSDHDTEEIVVVNGKPYLKNGHDKDAEDLGYVLTSKTQFLVHKMDGTYVSYTGYKNVPSMIAHYAEIVVSEDENKEHVAEVVYLTEDVYMTDGKVVAYVGKPANKNVQEVKEDTKYYGLTIYVDGEAKDVYVDADDLEYYFTDDDDDDDDFVPGFYELQNTEIDGVTIVKVLTAPADRDEDDMLGTSRKVKFFEVEELELITAVNGIKSFSYAKDMALYLIDGSKVEKTDLETIEGYFGRYASYAELADDDENTVENAHEVYLDTNSDDEITALYFVCASND